MSINCCVIRATTLITSALFSTTTLAQIDVRAIQDAYTNSLLKKENINYGSEDKVWVRAYGDTRGHVRFDLSSVPPGMIAEKATLRLDVQHVNREGPISVRKVKGFWDELTLNANNKPPVRPVHSSALI